MRIGCQTYSWEMQLKERPTTLWQMFDAIRLAGYEGVEFTNNTGGAWLEEPERVAEELQKRDLRLAAVAVSRNGFTDAAEMKGDLQLVETAVRFLRRFDGALLALGGAAHADQANWPKHLEQAIKFYGAAGEIANAAGVRCCVHPHSHYGSLIETPEQYEFLFAHLPAPCRWCPDTGHIVRGGQDLMTCLKRYADRIEYIHMKDADAAGQWQAMGRGIIDFPAMFAWLKQRGFNGWLVAEEESRLAWEDPVRANQLNREYIRRTL